MIAQLEREEVEVEKNAPDSATALRQSAADYLLSSASALCAAAAILWAGSAPLAHLLQEGSLTPLLHWAAFSAAGMILLKCCRGFLVGQRRLLGILILSLFLGLGMISLLPAMSHLGPIPMVCGQSLLTTAVVLLCLLLYRLRIAQLGSKLPFLNKLNLEQVHA